MSNAKTHIVELRGNLGVRDAAAIAASLVAAIEAHPSVTIATDELSDVDVSILQVLAAAHKTASRAGRALTLEAGADGVLRRTLVKAGFLDAGGAPLAAEGQFWVGGAARAKGKAA
jgi:anti-anti-sigma regulatory factor